MYEGIDAIVAVNRKEQSKCVYQSTFNCLSFRLFCVFFCFVLALQIFFELRLTDKHFPI